MSKPRSLRLPDDLDRYIDAMPDEYGKDFTNKAIFLLYKGMKRLEFEKRVIQKADDKIDSFSGGNPDLNENMAAG